MLLSTAFSSLLFPCALFIAPLLSLKCSPIFSPYIDESIPLFCVTLVMFQYILLMFCLLDVRVCSNFSVNILVGLLLNLSVRGVAFSAFGYEIQLLFI